jgi:transcriptional regulator with PAS, ATPase and Fis domain
LKKIQDVAKDDMQGDVIFSPAEYQVISSFLLFYKNLQFTSDFTFKDFIHEKKAMESLLVQAKILAGTDNTILILGKTRPVYTGKYATLISRDRKTRRAAKGHWLTVNK